MWQGHEAEHLAPYRI